MGIDFKPLRGFCPLEETRATELHSISLVVCQKGQALSFPSYGNHETFPRQQ